MTKNIREIWNRWVNSNPDLFRSVERTDDLNQLDIIVNDISKKLDLKEGDRLLDIGCGSGLLLSRLVKKNKIFAVGIDYSEKQIEIAYKNFPYIKFVVAEAENLSFKNNFFNKVLCYSVFHYVKDWQKTIDGFIDITCNNGKILIGDIPDKKLKYKFYIYNFKKLPSLTVNLLRFIDKLKQSKKLAPWYWIDLDKICKYIDKLGFKYEVLKQPKDHRQYGTDTSFYRLDLLIHKKC